MIEKIEIIVIILGFILITYIVMHKVFKNKRH